MKISKKFILISLGCLLLGAITTYVLYAFAIKSKLSVSEAHNALGQTEYFDNEKVDSIYKYLQKSVSDDAQVAIAVLENDFIYYYGVQRKNDTLVTIENRDSIFQLGSISKVFTSIILSKMVEDGSVRLDNNIDDYLGYSLNDSLKLTFKSLSSHTSGLDRMPTGYLKVSLFTPFDPYRNFDEKWMVEYLKTKIEIDDGIRDKVTYSNLGAGLLGYTISKINKMSYEKMFDDFIFSKVGMKNTFITDSTNNTDLIVNSSFDGDNLTPWYLNVFTPAGGIASNAIDMGRFMKYQLDTNLKYVQNTHKATYHIKGDRSVGLGWFLFDKPDSYMIWHNGATGGYTASITIDKKSRKGVVILSNITSQIANSSLDKLGYKLILD